MVRLTLIARISDSLPLAEGLDSEKDTEIDQYKTQAKSLFKKFSQQPSSQMSRMSVDSGNYMFHYILQSGVAFLTLTEKGYPKKLAFQYLEELASEFDRLYGPQVDAAQRPYAFIKFDTFIQKTKKLYMDTRTQRNLSKLNEDLSEVHQIMTKNIADVLAQGTKLEDMSSKSHDLSDAAKKYKVRTEQMYRQAILRKYVPLGVVVVVVLLVIWLRAKFYGKH